MANYEKNIFDNWWNCTKEMLILFVLTCVFTALGIVLAERKIPLLAGFPAICNSFLTVLKDGIKLIAIILVPCFLGLYIYTVYILFRIIKQSINAGFNRGTYWRIFRLILVDSIFLWLTYFLAYNYLGLSYKVKILGLDLSILQEVSKGSIRLNNLFNFFLQCLMIIIVVFIIKGKSVGSLRTQLKLLLIIALSGWIYYNMQLIFITFKPYCIYIIIPLIRNIFT